ncbi:hypothetical protein L1987_47719 [Smallanthus sonchifolius]|uniref:Uncharacterized protein n=1 Tax=Smallanthus sonchifolius TaxID=185202 RepID=A0ACB9G4A5_9ASTR|nr:hypothetical protein L1987_47719 [Smallanthus sonchifolius]
MYPMLGLADGAMVVASWRVGEGEIITNSFNLKPVVGSRSFSGMSTTESQPVTEFEFAVCDCCGLKEECTAEYVERIRERYQGKWICGLCGEAVKEEIVRSGRLISAEEAMNRHMTFRRATRSSGPPPNPAVHLIAAIRQILRRSLDSPRSLRSMPCSPKQIGADAGGLARSESCISPSYQELEEPGEKDMENTDA